MFNRLCLLSTLMLFTACSSALPPLTAKTPQSPVRVRAKWVLRQQTPFVSGEIVLQLRPNAPAPAPFPGQMTVRTLTVQGEPFNLLRFERPEQAEAALQALRERPEVASVQYNPRYYALTTPVRRAATVQPLSDAFYPLQWALPKIGIPEAWRHLTQTHEILVAVIDSGVDDQHPDLRGQVINGPDFMPEDVGGPNGEGSPDAMDDDPIDGYGHGTHVTGIIAAHADNRTGIAGIAPRVKVLNIKALNAEGWGSAFAIAQGITHAADRGARVINLSLGGGEPSKPIELAVRYAQARGALIVAAAGNAFSHTGFPANLPGVVAVGATDSEDWLAEFTNHDKRIDVMAPGVDILSTTPTFLTRTMVTNRVDSFYSAMSGTSMACPMVAAEAALLLSQKPELTAVQVRDLIIRTARPVGDARLFGAGLIQIEAALRALGSETSDSAGVSALSRR